MRRVRRRAGRVGAIVSIWSPCQAGLSWSGSALVAPRGPAPGKTGQLLTLVVPVARQILMQVADRDIGQLTDIEAITTDRATVSGLRDLDRFGCSGYLFGRSAAGPSET